jgi:hypothetical protein
MALALIASLVAALPAAAASPANDADRLRQMADRIEIEDLMWRYCRALDTLSEDGYADVYTPDGTFTYNGETSRGRSGLKKVIADTRRTRQDREARGGGKTPPIYHVIATHTVTFTGRDSARYDSYWMTVYGTTGPEAPVRVNSVGRAIDELVRVEGRWLIKTRNISPDG